MKRTTLVGLFDALASGFIWMVAMSTLPIVLARDWLERRLAAHGKRGAASNDRDVVLPSGT
ncbi:hypothetical protein P9239_22935 [Caballeronia sp. LZ062]|uniref:hypothetical protein n=1 Tax=unclassified Caballeronia TaxID=2646786 RepID=UPI00285E5961|nr:MULTISPECIES: hypothetical protein [unclassified Caballeronia]MDR5856542.1 hypothetical protein [Caballeronia sp. LZ050]MDR5873212.1 hypothetical protein [Caballeronia sp. LZ062]